MSTPPNQPSSARLWLALLVYVALALGCGMTTRQGWRSALGPVVPHDTFPADCSLCHVGGNWHTLKEDFHYDHGKSTGVALVGAHERAQCLRCHNDRGPVKVFSQRGCVGCHEDVHQGNLGKECKSCHDERSWLPTAQIQKHAATRFPLVGAHAAVTCFRCHPGAQVGNFQRADIRCESCHSSDLARATNPDHASRGWTNSCERCHLPTAWQNARFDHSTWPLTGRHNTITCASCHKSGVYRGTPRDCTACHLDEYNATTSPRHASAGFTTACLDCHTTSSWRGARYNHASWALTGRHATAACSACHGNGIYAGTPTACVSCHLAEYNATTNPNHKSANFPTTCQNCHTNTTTWSGATFNHRFPITSGKHSGRACTDCHQNATNYAVFTCTSCHEHSQSTMNSKHQGVNGYSWTSPACYSCHPNGRN